MSRSTAAREKWAGIVEEQRASGLSVTRFCADRGIPASSVFLWKRKLKSAAGQPPPTEFVEAKVRGADDDGGGSVTIALAGGRRIMVGRGFDRQL